MTGESSPPPEVGNIGVINPYALAELVQNRRIRWDEVDAREVLEETFERPYEELFDPEYGSPLYPGLNVLPDGMVEKKPIGDLYVDVGEEGEEEPDTDNPQKGAQEERRMDPDLSEVKTLRDLRDVLNVAELGDLEVSRTRLRTPDSLSLEIRRPQAEGRIAPLRPFPKAIIEAITDIKAFEEDGWTPTGAQWSDVGVFFKETAEFFDPIQGAVADCYLIAGMSAVAWAHSDQIVQRTRATGEGQQAFVDLIDFYTNGSTDRIEVSEKLPVRNGSLIYARSSESGEIWPGVYEKAYAAWKTGTSSDKPKITDIAFGDPVRATDELSGGSRSYYATKNNSANTLWDRVRANSLSYKTFNPGVAWTYSSASAAPDTINYANANIVANHAYTILGWDYDNGTRYIVARNPWGRTEATIGRMSGVWTPYDESFWRRINLPDVDGTFAIDASTFKKYFAGLGFVT